MQSLPSRSSRSCMETDKSILTEESSELEEGPSALWRRVRRGRRAAFCRSEMLTGPARVLVISPTCEDAGSVQVTSLASAHLISSLRLVSVSDCCHNT